jgi:hypothetical protein
MGTDILVKKPLTVGILTPPQNISLIAHQHQLFAGVKITPVLKKLFLYPATIGVSMPGNCGAHLATAWRFTGLHAFDAPVWIQ